MKEVRGLQLPENYRDLTKEQLHQLYWEQGLTLREIGGIYEVSSKRIRYLAAEREVEIKDASESKLPSGTRKLSRKQMEELYCNQKMSTNELAKKCGASRETVIKWLRGYEIEVRPKSPSINSPSDEELGKLYEHSTLDEMAKHYDVSSGTIQKWLNEKGITRKKVRSNSWKSLEFGLEQARLFLEQHPEYSELPSAGTLTEEGCSSLSQAISKYHGGYTVFRERLKDFIGRPSDSLLEQYANEK
jgi:transposase